MHKYGDLTGDRAPSVFYALPELAYPRRLNAARVLLEEAIGRGWGSRTAYYYKGGKISFAELRTAVHKYAAVLTALGIRKGDSVLIRLEDRPELICALLAVQALGGVAVPTYVQLRRDDIAHRLQDCSAKIIITSAGLLDEIAALSSGSQAKQQVVVIPRSPDPDYLSMDDLLPNGDTPVEYEDTDADDIALLLYSSGSTGRPKAACHNHADLLAVCDSYCRYCLKLREDDVLGGPPAVPFALGYGFFALFTLRFGAAAVLEPEKSPATLLPVLRDCGVTVLIAVPTYYNLLSNILQESGLHLSRLRLSLVGGEPLQAHIEQTWHATTGIQLRQFLGTTEMLHIFLSTRDGIDEPKPGCLGRPVPGYEISIRDPDSFQPVADGEHGLLCVRGPTGTRYLNRPDVQESAVRDGWNIFRDVVWRDPDGYIHYVARDDDMIISAGYTISPYDVETVILSHPNVLECGCVAAPDPKAQRSSIVKAFIVLRGAEPSDAMRKTIQDYFKAKAAPYMYPREIVFLDALPKTASGKILRSQLRQMV